MTQSERTSAPGYDALGGAEAARLLRTLEAAEKAAREAGHGLEAAGGAVARHGGELDSLRDAAEHQALRGRDARHSVSQVRDGLERAKLAALNAGLEGARLGEPVGKVLVALADELRTLLARGVDTLDEHEALLAEIERERERWTAELDPVARSARALADELAKIRTLHGVFSGAIAALGVELRRMIGGDPETLAMFAEAGELADKLAKTLATIAGRPHQLPSGVLERLLEPLLALSSRPGQKSPP
jgi:methyl-accepting chemotaxis protein